MSDSPAVLLYDANGNPIALKDGDTITPATQPVLPVAGVDGTTARTLRVDGSGRAKVQADSLPLPTGAATETTLATLATETKLEAVRALLATIDADTSILSGVDYATQTTLAALLSAFNAEDFASETTLAAAKAVLDTIDAVLDSIKDTDGIKKITDPVVIGAGDAGIGRVKVWDGTEVADVYLDDGVNYLASGKNNKVDANNSSVAQLGSGGTFIGTATDVSNYASVGITVHSDQDSALDGMRFEFSLNGTNWDDSYKFNLKASQSTTRRFQFPVCAKYFRVYYVNGTTITSEFRVQTILNRSNILSSIHRVESVVREDRSAQLTKSVLIAQREGALNTSFYPIQADVSGNLKVTTIGSDIPPDPTAFVLEFLENGGSNNMRVNGSVTPVTFSKGPTVTDEQWSIREILLTFTADDFSFDGLSFGPNPALTNGFILEVVKNSVVTPVFTVKQNEDFLRVPGRTPLVNNTGPKDVLGASLSFDGLILNQTTSDLVRIRIRDDLTSIKLKYLTATLFASRID